MRHLRSPWAALTFGLAWWQVVTWLGSLLTTIPFINEQPWNLFAFGALSCAIATAVALKLTVALHSGDIENTDHD